MTIAKEMLEPSQSSETAGFKPAFTGGYLAFYFDRPIEHAGQLQDVVGFLKNEQPCVAMEASKSRRESIKNSNVIKVTNLYHPSENSPVLPV